MPTYSISGPDGRTYSIEGPEGATREQVISAIQARLAEQPVETVAPAPIQPKESTIGGEFRRGISSLLSGARTGVGAIFGSPEEAAMAGVERSREISEAAGEGPSLSRIGRVYEERGLLPAAGQVAADVPKLLAQQAPQIGTAIAGGRLGAMAGSAFGPAGTLIGGGIGAAVALAPSIFGQSVERQAQEQMEAGQPVDISTGRAAAATLGSVALEATGLGLTLGKTAVKSLLGVTDDAALLAAQNKERLARAAEATLLGTAVRGAGRGAVVEMPVEVAQSVLERWQAGLDVTSPEALQEYGESMYAAGLVGGPLGAVGGIQTRREAQQLTLAPGQEPGESLYDTAARLNAQIQTLDQLIKQADVEAAKSQIGVMSGTDLIDMYRNQGYGAVKQYQISLEEKAQDTELSKEQRQEAAKAAKDVGSLLEQVTTEEVARKFFAAPNVINNRDIDNLGFSKDDPVRDKILNKDINNPDQAAEILSVLEAEKKGADPVRLETINTALETINGYLGSAFYGAIQQPSREGVSVAGVPGGRPAATRPPTLEPTGVVRPETDVRGVVGREAVEPAPVAPVTAPQSLAQVGDAGTAIVANMYQAMLDAHQQGKTVVGGIPDPVLIAAARDGRQFKTIDEIKVYAQQPSVLNRSKNIARGIQIQNMMRAGQTLPDIQKTFPKIDVPKVLEKLQQELTPKKRSITPELEARAGEILKAQEAEAKEAKEAAPEVTPKTEKEAQIAQRQALITQLDGVLKRILAKYGLKDVKFNLKEALSTDPEGEYQRQVITLALNVDNPVRVLRHESIHALKDMGFFSDAQWKTLTKRANDEWIGVLKATPHSETQSRYDAYIDLFTQEGKDKGLSGESLTSYVNEAVVEEAIADAFGSYDATQAPPGLMSAILNRIRNLFKAIKEAFNLSGIETAEEIFGKIEKGKLKPAVPAAKEVKPGKVKPSFRFAATKDSKQKWFDDATPRQQDELDNLPRISSFDGMEFIPISGLVDSANSTYEDFELAPGVREIPINKEYLANKMYDTAKEQKYIADLAEQIKANQKIEPLIFGLEPDSKDSYVIEGQHRIRALDKLGYTTFPARVVVSMEGDRKDYELPLLKREEPKTDYLAEKQQLPLFVAKPSLRPSEENAWQATPKEREQAIKMFEEDGLLPYISQGFLDLPTEPPKLSLQRYNPEKHLAFDPVLQVPINKNGTVTVYYHTTIDKAKNINNKKVIPSEGRNRIYLTNESGGADVLRDRGNFDQELDGSTVLVYVTPDMLQVDRTYENGRVDFYLPTAQGDFFNKKMKLQSIQKARTQAIVEEFSYDAHEKKITQAIQQYKDASPKEREAMLKNARAVLKREHNVSSLMTENGKLEKTRIGEYELSYDGLPVASQGLGLASAQKISEKISTCPRSAICEGLCLGETSGGNFMFGGAAAEDVGEIQKSAFRAAARMMQYLKTEALIVHPKEFSILLQSEIDSLRKWAASPTQLKVEPETKKRVKVEKEIYRPAVRLNVTSDFKPEMFRAVIEGNPDVMFYDYTKIGSDSIAPNHHLTYSSTGFGQIVGGEKVFFKNKAGQYDHNWSAMKGRLNDGFNVAMAFSSKSAIPKFVRDEESGITYRVLDGDDYDARFLDEFSKEKRDSEGRGVIVGLRNKAGTLSEKTATEKTGGFFVNYDPKQGDTVVAPNQAQFKGKRIELKPEKLSLRSRWSDDRIDSLVRQYGYTTSGRENDAKAYAAFIRPQEFLNATASKPMQEMLREEIGTLDVERLATQSPMHLIIKPLPDGRYQIADHEGRHRMMMLSDAGYTDGIPVVLQYGYDSTVKNATDLNNITLRGQRNGRVYLKNISIDKAIPISWNNRNVIKETFGGEADVKFSLRSLVSNAMTPQVTATVNKIAPPRYDPTLWERILNAVSGDSFTKLRSQIINRYEILAKYDRRVAEMIRQSGGVQQLADQKAESAALFSDLTSGLLASALGANDKFGGAPVFRNGITVISNQNGTVKGPVLIFKPLADLKSPEVFRLWQTYVAVKRGVRLDALGKEHLIDQADVKAMKTMAQSNPQLIALFESVRKDWIKYNDALVKYMQDTGVITPKMAQEWTRHGDYFPFYRLAEEDVVGPRGFRSIANVTPPKALKGGENPLGDFFENVVRNSQAAIQAGIKNVAAQRATEQGLKLKEVVRLPRKRSGVNVYRVLENGQEVYYESADPLFIDAIKSLNMPDLPFLGLLAGPANLLRNLVTKDPAFMLANMMRDSLSAYTTSGVKMTPFVDTIKNFGKAIANRSPETRDLYAAGVLGGYDYSKGVKTSAREFEQRLREVSGTKTPTEKLLTPITSLWGALEKGTQASDAATRAEVYKRVLAETGNEAEAYWQALEVMNFNRRGNSPVVRVLTAAIPFLNARMQGLDLLYRTAIFPLGGTASEAAKQRMKTFWVRGMTLMSLSMMYWALTHDDEEYKKQEQETRDNYWLFPSLGIKIPIPFEVGVMFKVIPERLAALTLGDDTYKDFTKSMVRQLTSTFGINLIPQAALPIAEVTTNYSFFTGRSIIGKGLEDVAPQYQISPGTSRVAEMIGQSLGMSPIKLDHLLKGYTGSLGMYASDLFDMVFDMNSDAPKASKRFEQMPIIKRFAVDPEARGTVTAYYELKDSVDEVVRTSNLLERSMNYKDYGQYMTENIRMLATKDYINALERNMKEFREMKLAIRTSGMSAEAKRDALTSIGRMESQLTQNIQTLKKNAQ